MCEAVAQNGPRQEIVTQEAMQEVSRRLLEKYKKHNVGFYPEVCGGGRGDPRGSTVLLRVGLMMMFKMCMRVSLDWAC